MKPERRITPFADTELRVDNSSKGPQLVGYVSIFNRMTAITPDFREQVAPTFFEPVLSGDVRCLFNHDSNFVLGRTASGTMRLSTDIRGLKMEVDAPSTGIIHDLVVEPIRRGDISGASFSFLVAEDRWDKGSDGVWERTLLRAAAVDDVGPVTFPAYRDTSMAVRSLDLWRSVHGEPPIDLSARHRAALRQRRLELQLAAE